VKRISFSSSPSLPSEARYMKFTLLFIIIAIAVICWIVYQFVTGKRKIKVIEVPKPEEPKTPSTPATPPVA